MAKTPTPTVKDEPAKPAPKMEGTESGPPPAPKIPGETPQPPVWRPPSEQTAQGPARKPGEPVQDEVIDPQEPTKEAGRPPKRHYKEAEAEMEKKKPKDKGEPQSEGDPRYKDQ